MSYRLLSNLKKQQFRAEVYLFLPKVLSINPRTYSAAKFYADTARFIRMTSPKVPLSELSRKSAVKPWASDIKQTIDRFAAGEESDEGVAEQGLKLLACVFKSAVRDAHNDVATDVRVALDAEDWTLAKRHLAQYLDDLKTALQRIHKVGERSDKKGVPELLRECWSAVDEYASLLAEESVTDLVRLCSDHQAHVDIGNALEDLQEMAIEQYLHRRKQGYKSYAKEGARNEYLPHRWRVLKRYLSSALYLNATQNTPGSLARDFIAMLAAAMAMLFAASATVVIMNTWTASLSTAFITAMVISYVVKDRIKDVGKRYLGKHLNRYISDHVVDIHGVGDVVLGQAEESFHIRPRERCEEAIQTLRMADLTTREAIEGRPENVLCYTKDMTVFAQQLTDQFAGAEGLTDIVRLNFQPFLSRMDDHWEMYQYIHPTTKELCETKCARVYHLNVVLRLFEHDTMIDCHRVRAVVNKKGIVRIEEVGEVPRTLSESIDSDEGLAEIRMFDE